jgi:hypothetical protein
VISDNASMTGEDFAAQYQVLSDGALTQLASEGGLRSEADTALRAEMRKRSIGTKEVRSLRVTQKKAKLQRVNHNPYSYQGTGLRLRGHKFLNEADGNKGIAVVTRWIVFSFMPLMPLGSYRVMEPGHKSGKPTIISKVRLQWDQVLVGWMQTGSIVILLGCIWLWLRWFAGR